MNFVNFLAWASPVIGFFVFYGIGRLLTRTKKLALSWLLIFFASLAFAYGMLYCIGHLTIACNLGGMCTRGNYISMEVSLVHVFAIPFNLFAAAFGLKKLHMRKK